ncbi:hypothetical protein HYR65_00880, partial [Candidatus Azambacteria bacterium]|nr:hypothetical protein [Candidatus Azambacteria bacterium]
PAALLVQSRTPKKSFVFLLEEIGRAQNQKCRENFFAGWRVVASGGGLASLVRVRLVKSSDFVQETQPIFKRKNRVETSTLSTNILTRGYILKNGG